MKFIHKSTPAMTDAMKKYLVEHQLLEKYYEEIIKFSNEDETWNPTNVAKKPAERFILGSSIYGYRFWEQHNAACILLHKGVYYV